MLGKQKAYVWNIQVQHLQKVFFNISSQHQEHDIITIYDGPGIETNVIYSNTNKQSSPKPILASAFQIVCTFLTEKDNIIFSYKTYDSVLFKIALDT